MQFYTVNEAARILKVSRATVYRYIELGHLPAVQPGGYEGKRKILIPEESLQAFLRANLLRHSPDPFKKKTAIKEILEKALSVDDARELKGFIKLLLQSLK